MYDDNFCLIFFQFNFLYSTYLKFACVRQTTDVRTIWAHLTLCNTTCKTKVMFRVLFCSSFQKFIIHFGLLDLVLYNFYQFFAMTKNFIIFLIQKCLFLALNRFTPKYLCMCTNGLISIHRQLVYFFCHFSCFFHAFQAFF